MNRQILKIALPTIVTNITIPLLGLIDTSISGHLGRTEYIGAISVATMMFNLIYWNFGFLRMGTSGLTAQAYGKKDNSAITSSLLHSVMLAVIIAFIILILQYPLQWLALWLIGPSESVASLAREYYYICIWNAPPILIMMSIKGWFIGMQDAQSPMKISIGVNVVNIVTSLLAVFVFGMGFIGIAIGTVTASYIGLIYSLYLIAKHHPYIRRNTAANAKNLNGIGKFFRVNRDIFLRSTLLMLVTLFFTAQGARSGDVTLAANSIIMQLFILISYFMDGFAFAGEALVGRFEGERNIPYLKKCIRCLFKWGVWISTAYTLIYAFCLSPIFSLLTNDATVIAEAMKYYWWCVAIPFAGMAAFVWDGVFIGLTATRGMLLSIFIASASFFGLYYIIPGSADNNRLWLAFITYLLMRGITQTIIYRYKLQPK